MLFDEERADFGVLLDTLARHGVEFIVVGGLAAVVQGAPIFTSDLDIVHRRTPDNIAHLLAALRELQAVYRARLPERIEPTASHLESAGHQLLSTRAGRIDVLGTVDGHDHDALTPDTVLAEFRSIRFRTLTLERVIALKTAAGRDKDKAVLPVLRRTLELRRERGG
jgi:predicted nucleotidyltransferase